jgi:surface protein
MWLSSVSSSLTTVVFDESFKNVKPQSTAAWFSGCSKLQSIEGIENLNTENVTKMSSMFSDCQTLDTLDLSKFDTKSVMRMDNMFKECLKLTTIYVGDDWNTENVENSEEMFLNCLAIVGQDGTTYDEESTDKAKAHYDEGGYLTYKPPYLLGDANSDGEVNMTDAMYITKFILGNPDPDFNIEAADANLDGRISLQDVMFIVNYYLNGKFPDEK